MVILSTLLAILQIAIVEFDLNFVKDVEWKIIFYTKLPRCNARSKLALAPVGLNGTLLFCGPSRHVFALYRGE
jgi:hypothetical protein